MRLDEVGAGLAILYLYRYRKWSRGLIAEAETDGSDDEEKEMK